MKHHSKAVVLLMLFVLGALANGAAMARGGHGGAGHGGGYAHGGGYSHGSGYGHGFGYGVGVGMALGIPLYGLGYYSGYYPYPYAYPEPDYVYPPAPAAAPAPYVQQGYPQAAPTPQQDWYYCTGSNAYYPYVTECPGGWQRVPSQPQR